MESSELRERKAFVKMTKNSVKDMKEHLAKPHAVPPVTEDAQCRQMLLRGNGPSRPMDKYMHLENEIESSNQQFLDDTHAQQQLMVDGQDDQLHLISGSVGVLKNMSQQIGTELDEQSVMLDDFAHEMDTTDSKMDNVMKKMAKVLHMSNDRRQWCAIGVLLVIMFIVILLFFVIH
ncbi:hypothetical protein NP493_668g01011 [Ridgeia piscesae]|uniref:t-SNARE coiled-coil homology domain-containing protein n=1 Tax=Ridgeia piscesae TaxID=27915 RepID=A0AAD9KRK2_RIDPI|nr:hypothetical protein NP493_668g01011 [Ridgeia piscesae]